jgi:hypothetical protein
LVDDLGGVAAGVFRCPRTADRDPSFGELAQLPIVEALAPPLAE